MTTLLQATTYNDRFQCTYSDFMENINMFLSNKNQLRILLCKKLGLHENHYLLDNILSISPHEQPWAPTLLYEMRVSLAKILNDRLSLKNSPDTFVLSRDRIWFSWEKANSDDFYGTRIIKWKKRKVNWGISYNWFDSPYQLILNNIWQLSIASEEKQKIINTINLCSNANNRTEFWKKYNEILLGIKSELSDTLNNNLFLLIKDWKKYITYLYKLQTLTNCYSEKTKTTLDTIRVTDYYDIKNNKLVPIVAKIKDDNIILYKWEYEYIQEISFKDLNTYIETNTTSWPTAIIKYILSVFCGYIRIDDGKDLPFTYAMKDFFNDLTHSIWLEKLKYPIIAFPEEYTSQTRCKYPFKENYHILEKSIENFF